MTGSIAYMTGSTDPWYVKPADAGSPDAAMTKVFGPMNTGWAKYQGYSTTIFNPGNVPGFLYLDGGFQDSTAYDAFVSTNIVALEKYVYAGGILYLNASRYDTSTLTMDTSFTLGGATIAGFGVTLNHGYSASATASGPSGAALSNGPNGAAGSSWTGGYFANDYLTSTPTSSYISLIDGPTNSVLGYEKYGAGMVIFGGLSDPKYDLPTTQADNLVANILSFGDNAFVPTLTTVIPGTLEQGQTTVIGHVTPFQTIDTLVVSAQTETQSGVVSLSVLNNGTYDVLYTARGGLYTTPPGAIPSKVVEHITYSITDTSHTNTPNVASGTSDVQLDPGATISGSVASPGTIEKGQTIQIGSVAPGILGDALTVTSTAAGGTVSIDSTLVAGSYKVLYTALPAVTAPSHADAFTFTVKDQYNDVAPSQAASVVLDYGPVVTASPLANVGTIEVGQSYIVGTVTAGLAGDTLSIQGTATGGTYSLGAPSGLVQNVIYTATLAGANLADVTSYVIKDQYNDASSGGTANIQIDKGPSATTALNLVVGHGLTYGITMVATGATVGLSGDTLKFATDSATLGSVATILGGATLNYTAPAAIFVPTLDTVTYTINDQYNDVSQPGVAHVTIDPGPTAQDVTGSVTVGKTLVVGTVTPGLTIDNLTLNTTGALGTLALGADGTLTYTANGTYNLPSFGHVDDIFTYTVHDQWGDTITKNADITVNNMVNYINGPTYGNGTTTGGAYGDNVVTLTGFYNTLILSQTSSDVVNGGDGNTTITKQNGDLESHLRGYNNTITAGIGNHTIDGSAGVLNVTLQAGNNNISFGGFNNTIKVGNGNNTIYQPVAGDGGANYVKTGNGTQTIVLGGNTNTVIVGDNTGPGTTFINAGPGGVDTVTAGNGNHYILAGGYHDNISVGNGTDVIFATNTAGTSVANPSGTPSGIPNTGVSNSGLATVTLGNTAGTVADFFVYLGGIQNTVFLGSSAGAHLTTVSGGQGSDNYVLATNGGNAKISGFQLNGGDKVDVSQFFSSSEFAALTSHAVITTPSAGEAIVTLSGASGSASLDLLGTGVGIATPTQLLSHFTYGH